MTAWLREVALGLAPLSRHPLRPQDVDLSLQQTPLVRDLTLPPFELLDQLVEIGVAQCRQIRDCFHMALSSGSAGRLIEAAGRSRVNLYLRFAARRRSPPQH